MPTELTIEIAEEILPYLVYLAQQRRIATYGDLAEWTGRSPRNFNYPLGYIRDEILEPRGLPLLHAVVVSASTGLPGDGFLPEGRDHLTDEAYEAAFHRFRDEVFSYDGWDRLLDDLGLAPIERSPRELDAEAGTHREVEARRPLTEKEVARRRSLRQFILHKPEAILLWGESEIQQDVTFDSGDRCDLLVDQGGGLFGLVNVRLGRRGELVAAIQDLVACREQLRQQRDLPDHASITARIVAYTIPDEIKEYAGSQAVKCSEISEDRVKRTGFE